MVMANCALHHVAKSCCSLDLQNEAENLLMKNYIAFFLAASVVLSAGAAPAPRPVLGPGVNAPDYKLTAPKEASWPAKLVGKWKAAEDRSAGTAGGVLTLNKDKTLSLQPDGMYELRGYWYVKDGKLTFDTPVQVVSSSYTLSTSGVLTIQYSNGMRQTFKR